MFRKFLKKKKVSASDFNTDNLIYTLISRIFTISIYLFIYFRFFVSTTIISSHSIKEIPVGSIVFSVREEKPQIEDFAIIEKKIYLVLAEKGSDVAIIQNHISINGEIISQKINDFSKKTNDNYIIKLKGKDFEIKPSSQQIFNVKADFLLIAPNTGEIIQSSEKNLTKVSLIFSKNKLEQTI